MGDNKKLSKPSYVIFLLLQISCEPLSSSSSKQFSLEVLRVGGAVVRRLETSLGVFQVGELQSGTTYKVVVRAENRHGRSDPVYLLVQTTNEPIKQIAETKVKEEAGDYNEMLAITIGVVVSLIIMVVMIVIAVFTIRFQAGLRAELSRSDSDMRLTSQPRVGYCTTISSDIEVKQTSSASASLSLPVKVKYSRLKSLRAVILLKPAWHGSMSKLN